MVYKSRDQLTMSAQYSTDTDAMTKPQKNKTKKHKQANIKLPSGVPNLIKSASITETQITEEGKKEYIEKALNDGQALWYAVKEKAQDPNFANLADNEKIGMFTKFHPFNKEFPIVSRYLICMGQYSGKAFKRYLLKVQNTKHPAVREKGYMEDQWVCRQADYVRYLWESYQRGHYDQTHAKTIWQEAYKTLKQEFIDFRTMHTNIEKKLDSEKKINKEELVSELMNRLANGEQTLEENKMKELLEVIKIQLFQQRKERLMTQIKGCVPEVRASYEAFGTAPAHDSLTPG